MCDFPSAAVIRRFRITASSLKLPLEEDIPNIVIAHTDLLFTIDCIFFDNFLVI
jgi:hypothetical protein